MSFYWVSEHIYSFIPKEFISGLYPEEANVLLRFHIDNPTIKLHESKKNDTNKFTDSEKEFKVAKGEEWGERTVREFGIDMYSLL